MGPSPQGSVPLAVRVKNSRYPDYLNNRYYDPTLGNFISVDPLVGQTGTPYLYAAGNPSTLADPSGLCATLGLSDCLCKRAWWSC